MKVELRNEKLNEVRKANYVPGVIYGKSMESTNIKIEKQELLSAISEYGKSMVFKIRLDGKYHQVYFKNIQSRVLKPNDIIHVDLHRVTAKETITNHIPIEVVGQEKFFNRAVYVEMNINEVTCEYTPGQGSSSIVVDVSHLELGDHVYIKDLKYDEHMVIKGHHPTDVVITIKENKAVEEEVETEEVVIDTEEVETEEK